MRIGQAADRAGVNLQTLRYYERRGLLAEPPRSASGYRIYTARDVQAVRFIKRAQELGFSLADTESLVQASRGAASCDLILDLAREKLAELDRRIDALRSKRVLLRRLAAGCGHDGPARRCSLIEKLEAAAATSE